MARVRAVDAMAAERAEHLAQLVGEQAAAELDGDGKGEEAVLLEQGEVIGHEAAVAIAGGAGGFELRAEAGEGIAPVGRAIERRGVEVAGAALGFVMVVSICRPAKGVAWIQLDARRAADRPHRRVGADLPAGDSRRGAWRARPSLHPWCR